LAVDSDLHRYSIVTLAERELTLPKSASYAWHPELVEIHADGKLNIQQARATIEQSLNDGMRQRGYLRVHSSSPSDYWLGYTVALESMLSDEAINRRFGLEPGFVTQNSGSYEKGTLIVDLVEAKSRRVVWRSAAQGLVHTKHSEDVRRHRLESAVRQMLAGLPDAK